MLRQYLRLGRRITPDCRSRHHAVKFTTASTDGEGRRTRLTIGVKANIAANDSDNVNQAQDENPVAASRMLEPHASPFSSTVVQLLRQQKHSLLLHQPMDEFGMGSHSQYAYPDPVTSPYSRNGVPLSPGGSSGGGAVSVAKGESDAAVGTDTGGSVRLPASYLGVVGFKPSYGRISRWGVIQYANSLDTVGVLGKSVGVVREVFGALDGEDERDMTCLKGSLRTRMKEGENGRTKMVRIGIPAEYNIAEVSGAVRSVYASTLRALQRAGHTLHPVSLPSTRAALSAYYVLAPAEASSNLAKYDGIRYGHRTDTSDASPHADQALPLYASTRGEGFGEEVKRRILLGAYTLSADALENYFLQAQRVRRVAQKDFDRVFGLENPLLDHNSTPGEEDKVDFLLTPTAPTLPPTIEDLRSQSPLESYMNDVFTVPASLAGLPAISVPAPLSKAVSEDMEDTDVKSVGMQILGQFGDDEGVLEVAEMLEKLVKK